MTSGSFDLTATAPVLLGPIPTGTVCVFTETLTAQPGDFADASYAWLPSAPTVATVGTSVTPAVITNTYLRETGDLVIAKTVDGDGYIGTGTPFLVDYDCDGTAGQIAVGALWGAAGLLAAGLAAVAVSRRRRRG